MRFWTLSLFALALLLTAGCEDKKEAEVAKEEKKVEQAEGEPAGEEAQPAAGDEPAHAEPEAGQPPQDDQAHAQQLWEEIQGYEQWPLFPGTEKLYEGTEPHGALLTTYVNQTALDALSAGNLPLPEGSVIVKENYSPEQQLMAVTLMSKKADFAPDAGNWFWVKRLADGTIEAAGAVEGCIGCHGAGEGNDFIRTALPAAAPQ